MYVRQIHIPIFVLRNRIGCFRMSLAKLTKYLLILFVTTSSLYSGDAVAQSFDKGYSLFKKGKYKKAKRYLGKGLRETSDRYDKALIYKLLGITEYKVGSKRKASTYFKKAVKLDPGITMSRKEAKSRGALSMFNKIKKRSGGGRSNFRGARRSNRSTESSGKDAGLLAFAPFGAGQFIQGKTLLGSGLAAGQAFGLFLYFERDSAAKAADAEALSIIEDQEANSSYTEEEFAAYLDSNEEFVLAARSEAQNGLYLFVGLYAAGVAEAILNKPTPSKRSGAIERAESKLADNEVLESLYLSPKAVKKKTWDLKVLPTRKGAIGQLTWSKTL